MPHPSSMSAGCETATRFWSGPSTLPRRYCRSVIPGRSVPPAKLSGPRMAFECCACLPNPRAEQVCGSCRGIGTTQVPLLVCGPGHITPGAYRITWNRPPRRAGPWLSKDPSPSACHRSTPARFTSFSPLTAPKVPCRWKLPRGRTGSSGSRPAPWAGVPGRRVSSKRFLWPNAQSLEWAASQSVRAMPLWWRRPC